jgi:hypothetical protein
MYLDNLGLALHDRYDRDHDPGDFARALQAHEQAVAGLPADAPERPRYLSNLAACLWAGDRDTADAGALARAIDLFGQAVAATPRDSPNLAMRLNNLALGLRDRHRLAGAERDLEAAREAFGAACAAAEASPGEGLRAARNWGRWAGERRAWAEAAQAFGLALDVTERLFQTQLVSAHKEAWLREASGVPAGAAHALVRSAGAAAAALVLERGRALLLSETLQRDRVDLEHLAGLGHGDLAARYRSAARRLGWGTADG